MASTKRKTEDVIKDIDASITSIRDNVNRLVKEHCDLTDEKRKDVHEIVSKRQKLAKSTNITEHVWNVFSPSFRFRSEFNRDSYEKTDNTIELSYTEKTIEGGTEQHYFQLHGNSYILVASKGSNWLPDGSTEFYEITLSDSKRYTLLLFRAYDQGDDMGSNYIPSGSPEAFVPGDWVGDFLAASQKYNSIIKIEREESRNSNENIEDLKSRYGIK